MQHTVGRRPLSLYYVWQNGVQVTTNIHTLGDTQTVHNGTEGRLICQAEHAHSRRQTVYNSSSLFFRRTFNVW